MPFRRLTLASLALLLALPALPVAGEVALTPSAVAPYAVAPHGAAPKPSAAKPIPRSLAQQPVTQRALAQRAAPAPLQLSRSRPVHDGEPLRAQCWQNGVRIVDEGGLRSLSIDSITEQTSVAFKRQGDEQPTVFLLPFEDGLCLVQPER